MVNSRSLVALVDDDVSVRESIPDLLVAHGYAVRAFSSAAEFLSSDCLGKTECLVLDICMPGMTGPELQKKLQTLKYSIPIVFVTAHADEMVRPRLLEQGAVDCLIKPFSEAALLAAISTACGGT